MNKKKLFAIIFITILIINGILFGTGKIGWPSFLIIIGIAYLYVKLIQPKM